MRWNLDDLYPWGLPEASLVSPVQNWRKFSAVLGVTSLKSSNVMRPSGSPVMSGEFVLGRSDETVLHTSKRDVKKGPGIG